MFTHFDNVHNFDDHEIENGHDFNNWISWYWKRSKKIKCHNYVDNFDNVHNSDNVYDLDNVNDIDNVHDFDNVQALIMLVSLYQNLAWPPHF